MILIFIRKVHIIHKCCICTVYIIQYNTYDVHLPRCEAKCVNATWPWLIQEPMEPQSGAVSREGHEVNCRGYGKNGVLLKLC